MLRNCVKIYNHNIPQRALKHQTPFKALKQRHAERPELSLSAYISMRVLTLSEYCNFYYS